jgi:AraC-like DNA-binding protein
MQINLQSFRPCRALQPFINCYVSLAKNPDSWEQLLIPSSIQNLGFIFGGSMTSSLDKDSPVNRSFVVGQQEQPQTANFGKDLEIITVFFKPTGMYRLFGYSMHLFTDKAIDFELICCNHDKYHVQKILESPSTAKRVTAIEEFLLGKLSRKSNYHSQRIDYGSQLIMNRNGNIPINRLASELNMSKRNLERHFNEQVGISPKSFSGISRIKKILELVERNLNITWRDVSKNFEYTDHSHFIHEFRKFTGKTPHEYFQSTSHFEHFVYTI